MEFHGGVGLEWLTPCNFLYTLKMKKKISAVMNQIFKSLSTLSYKEQNICKCE